MAGGEQSKQTRLVAIGDIHGEYKKLTELFQRLGEVVDLASVKVVFLGDYVDGGPDTSLVIDALMQFGVLFPKWVFLRGNHEQMLLDAMSDPDQFDTWFLQGGAETFRSYLDTSTLGGLDRALAGPKHVIPQTHLNWMDSLPYYHETESFYFVHAGFVPNIPVEQSPLSALLWIRDDYIKSTYNWGKIVVSGHTPQLNPRVMSNKILIDTMRHGKGPLTAVILNDNDPRAFEFVSTEM